MRAVTAVTDAVMDHSRIAIALMLLVTVVAGVGAPMVDQSSSLDQFQSDTDASQTMDYIEANFSAQAESTTTAQIIVRDGNVLSKEALLSMLEFERTLVENATINGTLVDENALAGIPNVVATAAIRQERGQELRARATQLQADRRALEENRSELESRRDALNATAAQLRGALTQLRENPSAPVRPAFDRVDANSSVDLGDAEFETFEQAVSQLRSATNQSAAEDAYRLGTLGVLQEQYAALETQASDLQERGQALADRAESLQEDRDALESGPQPNLSAQIDQLESMNATQVENVVELVLSESDEPGSGQVFVFMPQDYQPGSTEANATMLVVTQSAGGNTASPVGLTGDLVDAQLAMRDVGQQESDGLEYLVFGGGVITSEIDSSMSDSMTIVGPLALLFVLVALAIAYRDLLDIVLGVLGIGIVLTWTFGFMGWAGINFNQLFVAVPVLLIGLSIDYAIHIFMRHREERTDLENGPRGSMRVALAGVGVALVWVTATTVIGFLSNLTSPVGPIREFGIVSSVGIVSALLVFGILTPALKVELDELLERVGFDRRKRALGTGDGRASSVLAIGATAAKKAPYVVIVLALLVTAVGAFGGSQVSTSFDQADFLADDPPDWMKDLPEPFKPSEYTAKENLEYVNQNFVREDSTAEILIRGDLTDPGSLDRIAAATETAATQNVTQQLSSGDVAIQSPLSAMRAVAASNESFNRTFTAADDDGDGVPDGNLTAVYGTMFDVAPQQAGRYIHRVDGDYVAARMIVSVQGGAPGAEVVTQMDRVAATASGDGFTAAATGMPILNEIVQDQLLETVVQSLAITLVAVFLFLMLAYRLTNGSATLGAVTLMPVALSVAWILGTMYAMGVPFNVMTGMITSLTIGLGVAYSIHLSERYTQELERHDTVWGAMRTAVTGTGGALLGSAATTVGGFGVLVFAILPPLQQFGLITGLTIIYAFLGSVLVLPSLLVVWTRYAGPGWAREQIASERGADVDETAPTDD